MHCNRPSQATCCLKVFVLTFLLFLAFDGMPIAQDTKQLVEKPWAISTAFHFPQSLANSGGWVSKCNLDDTAGR
jgi:hypothetical protein